MDDDALANFAAITGTTSDRAQQYLRLTDGNLEQAFELFYANDGADLEGATSSTPAQGSLQTPSDPTSTSAPSGRGPRYQDSEGVVYVDSDIEQDPMDDEVQITGTGPRRPPVNGDRRLSRRAVVGSTPLPGDDNAVDEDEVMARRLQEEYYGSTTVVDVDAQGVRAPIARTTETLIDPGSFDANDEAEMRAAVVEQMRARRQHRPRGAYPPFSPLCSINR